MRHEVFWLSGTFAAIVIVAALVNRFRPAHKKQIRRLVVLFVLQIVALGVAHACKAAGSDVWASRTLVVAELLKAFTLVNLAGTAIFSVLLPAIGAALPMIASDLLVGLGYMAATLGVLSTHGLNLTGALASAAVVSAVLAISLQSTLGNILGGVALQLDGSIREGDWIQLENGKQGRIRAIRWRHTVVETRDWSTIIVPNASLLASNIMILGKREGQDVPQRMWIWFNVDFRYSPTRVIDVVTEALRSSPIPGVATNPPPNCVCMDFTRDRRESFATYAVRYWLTDLANDDPTSSRVRARIYTALRRAGIPFAIPASTMWVQVDDDTRADKKRSRENMQRVQSLKQIPLFRSLTDDELHTLAEGLSPAIYTAGETITKQGSVANWLYILTSGTVEIRTNIDPDGPDGPASVQSRLVTSLKAPDVFGEMSLMTGEARSADVVATTDVECFRLDKETFQQVLLPRPEIANELSEKLAKRRIELIAAREGLDERQIKARESAERDRILRSIRSFFSL